MMGGAQTDDGWTSFLVERYLSSWAGDTAQTSLAKDREAAQSAAAAGLPVRHVRTVCLPGDETCFSFFRAASEAVVRDANERAGLRFDRIVAVEDTARVADGDEGVEWLLGDRRRSVEGEERGWLCEFQ